MIRAVRLCGLKFFPDVARDNHSERSFNAFKGVEIFKRLFFSQIINPVEEQVDDSEEQIVEQTLAQYAPDCDAESDKEDEPQRLVSTNEALDALDVLYLYEAQQETKDSLRLSSLCAWRRDLVHCQSTSKKRTVLDTYFHSLS